MKLVVKILFVLGLLFNVLYSQNYSYVLPNETLLVNTSVNFDRLYIHKGGVLIVKESGLLEVKRLVIGLSGERDSFESIIHNHGRIIADTVKLIRGVSLFNFGVLKSRFLYSGLDYSDEENVTIKNYGDMNVDTMFVWYSCYLINYKNMKLKYFYNGGIFYTSGGDIEVDYLYNSGKIVLNVSKVYSGAFVSASSSSVLSSSSVYLYSHVRIDTDTLGLLDGSKVYLVYLDNNHIFVKQYCYIAESVSFVDYTSKNSTPDKNKKSFCIEYRTGQICKRLTK